ncbi:hypothetical protein [Ekhidna sp.]|uniref:hypothetical protein n=1 Tax=Ekhidna sp. TaxID=2608089 RepID=UPI003B503739
MAKPTHTDIRMYRTGTGDCFVLKFFAGRNCIFTMMIDGGTWGSGITKSELRKHVNDLKKYVNNKLDLLVITHEHKDHVYLFNACETLFTNNFVVDEVWMAWSENDEDEFVKQWKEKYGQKKRSFAEAVAKVNDTLSSDDFKNTFNANYEHKRLSAYYNNYRDSLNGFAELHFELDARGKYKGGLRGMEVVKNKIGKDKMRFFEPGNVETINGLPGVKFYILGPPKSIKAVKKEHGKHEGDTYDHNKVLSRSDSFSAAVSSQASTLSISPFKGYTDHSTKTRDNYSSEDHSWRRIDNDWLLAGAGNLALRLNTGINNLSLAMAIEFEDSGRVMLFPGDAEFGSWESWHQINWEENQRGTKPLTEDLLNRTVFYKVAHHLSHNGTAKNKGLRMMKSKDLTAMATLDYRVISHNWKSTMPNRGILKDLLIKTKGKLIIMNEEGLYYDFHGKKPLKERIQDERKKLNTEEASFFKKNHKTTNLYHQVRIRS